MTPFVKGLLLGIAVGAALLKALELIVEELRRIRAYEKARESLRRFINGEREVRLKGGGEVNEMNIPKLLEQYLFYSPRNTHRGD